MAKPRPIKNRILEDIPRPSDEALAAIRKKDEEVMGIFYGGRPSSRAGAGVDAGTPVSAQADTSAARDHRAELSAQADNRPSLTTDQDHVVLPVERVVPDPDQPRKTFDQIALGELAESIRQEGQIQPIVVRPGPGDQFIIVAGERRWRACGLAGVLSVKALIRRVDAVKAFEIALVENVQRDSLLPLEEARAYTRLLEIKGIAQAQLARELGLDRRRLSEKLSILRLPVDVLGLLSSQADTFAEKHAIVLAQAPEGTAVNKLAARCATEGWSVARLREELTRGAAPRAQPTLFENVRFLVNQRGGFTLTVRARSKDEVATTIAELEATIARLRADFSAAAAAAPSEEEPAPTN